MLRSVLKKCCVVVFVILMPYCSGMSNIPTYVLGTDMNYLQPTIQAIYSLMSSTRGLKRIIVLETDDVYGSEIEERSFRELCTKSDTQILRWNVETLKNALSPALKSAYEKFRTKINKRWNFETVAIRALFPVLFNRDVLDRAGYLQGFNLKPREQFMDHFIWLDSDLVINKNLLSFYMKFLKALKNDNGIPQVTISVDLHDLSNEFDILEHSKARTTTFPTISGGVIAWNLDACRKLLSEKDLAGVLLDFYNGPLDSYHDEIFIRELWVLWAKWRGASADQSVMEDSVNQIQQDESKAVYVADKFFNIQPKDWIYAKLIYDFVDFYSNPSDDTRNRVIDSWMSMYPIYPAKDASGGYMYSIELLSGFMQEKIARRLKKLKSFLQDIELHSLDINKAEEEQILNRLSKHEQGKKRSLAEKLLKIAKTRKQVKNLSERYRDIINNTAKVKISKSFRNKINNIVKKQEEVENLLERCRDIMTNPVVIHWDQCLKPWIKIALVLLHKQLYNQSDITLETFLELLNNKDYYLDITDLMWLNNLVKWLRAEGENGDIKLKQRNRILITQRWFESLIKTQKRTFDQAIKILISSKEMNLSENYFKLAEKIWGKMHSVRYENDESSDKKSQLFEEISTLTGLPIKVWSDGLKSTIKWLYDFYRWSINKKEVSEEKRQKVYRWLDSFR